MKKIKLLKSPDWLVNNSDPVMNYINERRKQIFEQFREEMGRYPASSVTTVKQGIGAIDVDIVIEPFLDEMLMEVKLND
jgi:hypothetical protein